MRNNLRWYVIPVLGLLIVLASSMLACTSEADAVRSYMGEADSIFNEGAELEMAVSLLYETAGQLEPPEVAERCDIYGKRYDDILSRFEAVECPERCLIYRQYVINGMSYYRQEFNEFERAFAAGDVEHSYERSYYSAQAQEFFALVSQERQALAKVEEGITIPKVVWAIIGVFLAIVLAIVVGSFLGFGLGSVFAVGVGLVSTAARAVQRITGGKKDKVKKNSS